MAQQLDRADLHAGIEVRYPDNNTEKITPQILRDGLHELVDSAFIPVSDGMPGTAPASSTYYAATYICPADGVQIITPTQLAGLAQATGIVQVGILAADGTLDPEFGPGTGYEFDLASRTLRVFGGHAAPGDYILRDYVLSIKYVTGALTSAPGGPAGPVGFADLYDKPGDNPALAAELAALAPIMSPHFQGVSYTQTPAPAATGEEIVSASWVRNFLATQLNISPFSSGGGRIVHVCGRGQTTPGEVGNWNRPFASLPDAQAAAQDGDIVIVWPGGSGQDAFGRVYYTEIYLQTKRLSVHFMPGAIYGGDIFAGYYFGSAPTSHYFHGGEFLARILHARQSGGQSTVLVENAKFTGALGGTQYFANLSNGTGGAHVDQFTMRGCTFDSKRSAGSGAPIRNNGTTAFGDCDMLVDNCLVMTTETPCVIYSSRSGGTVQFLGGTECRPGPGQPALQSVAAAGSGSAVPIADWFRDLRPSGTGGTGTTYTAGAGISIDPAGVITNTLPRRTSAESGYEETKLTQYQHVSTTATRIAFDTNLVGTHFAAGVFTCPVAGLWLFPANVLLLPFSADRVYVNCCVYVNGVESGKVGEGTIWGGTATIFTATSYQFLSVGDTVEVRVNSNKDYSVTQLEVLAFSGAGKYTYLQAILQFAA